MSDETTIRVLIRGRVQGVGYRYWTARTARDLGLGGWVRNRRDGTVEAVFHGPGDKVDEMLAACPKGPPSANVESIERFEAEPAAAGEGGFEQRQTV